MKIKQFTKEIDRKQIESFDKYLGFPTVVRKSKSQFFSFVKERVWNKLKGWKEKVTSSEYLWVRIYQMKQCSILLLSSNF